MATRRRVILSTTALFATVALALGLFWFQPWKLVIDHRVDEALPQVALESPAAQESPVNQGSTVAPPATPGGTAAATSSPSASTTPARPTAVLLSRGTLISHEHSTSGRVSVVRQPDGSRVLAIADLDTSDGPDVHVWLSDGPVLRGEKGWHVFDDGRHLNLGTLKGNLGNQVYRIPSSADLTVLTSVSIWCERFDVSFGAAALTPAA